MKKSDPALAKQVKKDVKFLKEKAATKKTAKPKGSSFGKKITKAETAAYNTKNKVKIAKEAKVKIQKAREPLLLNTKQDNALRRVSGKVSQVITDRSRSATRAAGIAKRVAKKGK